jgi:hypothetical protein
MEKRSHRRIRDLDVLTAFQGLVANEIGCARISMMAREQETLPAMGRIQMRETNYLQIITSGLHRTAGPYRSTWSRFKPMRASKNSRPWLEGYQPEAKFRSILALRPPELSGRNAEHLSEMTRQVALVGKPHGKRNLR